jgi:sterol desaturase/sphingolipid hydroxylase (fatty acid hydroxylase superfamily)
VRLGYPVVMLVGLNGMAIGIASLSASKLWLLAVVGLAIGLSFAAERIVPYEAGWNDSHGDVARDWAHFIVNEATSVLGVAALPLLANQMRPFGDHWPRRWPFVVQVLGSLAVLDFGVTMTHWASHRLPALWRFHAVHHSVRRFYGVNGLMKHPIHQAIEMVVGVLPLLMLGLPQAVAAALSVCTAIQLLMQHSNVDYLVGPLGTVLALNEAHRFHHLKWAGIGDVNFGLFTNLWDRLLGTWSFDPSRRFASDDLGIGKDPDFPTSYVAQLVAPFRRRQSP